MTPGLFIRTPGFSKPNKAKAGVFMNGPGLDGQGGWEYS